MARGSPGAGNPFGALYMLVGLLTCGLSIAILVIVNQYLWEYFYYYFSSGGYNSWSTCYMQDPNSTSVNICYYSWAAAGLGLFFSLWLFFMQLCSGRSRHIPVCEVMVCLLAMLWWIGCATTATVYGKNADSYSSDNMPPPGVPQSAQTSAQQWAVALDDKEGYRTSVWAMGWASVGLWAIALMVTLKDCVSARKNPPPVEPVYAAGAPAGAYAAPVYQTPYYQAPPPQGAYPPPQGGAYPPPQGAYATAPAAGYPPPPSPFQGASTAPAGYPPAQAV